MQESRETRARVRRVFRDMSFASSEDPLAASDASLDALLDELARDDSLARRPRVSSRAVVAPPIGPSERFTASGIADAPPARASRPDRAPSRVNPSPVPIPRTMPRAAFASRAPSPEVTAWRGDRRVARWLAERARKDAERRLGPIRRAHRDLDWIIKRRRAQIANCRRDMKNERAERLAEAAERRRRLERLAVKPAARQHEHENAQSALDHAPPPRPPTRGTHQKT